MHPVLKTLAVTAAAAGAMIATPASARTYVGLSFGAGYPVYGYGYGYGYPPPYWGPPPGYWGPPVYGFGFGYAPGYRYGGWGHHGWGHRGWGHYGGWRGRHW